LPLRIAVEKALEKDPAERYQTMRDFVVDLRRAPRIRTAGPPPVPAASRKGVWLASVAVMLTLVVGASFWLLWRTAASFENPLQNAHFTRLTDFPGFEEDAAISPDGKFVAFVSDRDGPYDIWVSQVAAGQFFNLTKGKEQDSSIQVRRIGFSGDGSHIWIAGVDERLRLIPLMGGPGRPFAGTIVNVAWSADGTRVVYHNAHPGDPMFVADQTGGNPRQILAAQPGVHHHYPAWSPDGRWIYFASGTFNETDLWRVPSSGGAAQRLTETNTDVRYIVPLDDRIVLYVSRDKDGSGPWLWAFDVRRQTAHRISFGLEKYTSLSGSTDGRRLAATVSNPTASLWSVPILDRLAEEQDAQPYAVPTVRALVPRFAGSSLFYLSSRGTGDGLWSIRKGEVFEIWRGADGTLLEPPAPSPDGRRVGVVLRRQGRLRLALLTADGAEVQVLADSIEVKGSADWSPDGKWIVTGGNDGTSEGLFKIPMDGGAPVRLTKGAAENPVWSPDGRLIVYTGTIIGVFSPIHATRPDGTSLNLPEIMVANRGERYRFLPDGKSLIYMQGETRSQDFWSLDLATKKTRRLTHLNNKGAMRTFDIAPDGKHIVFDRLRENSDIVLIDLPGGPQKP
jgi:Tol biopolymer transport system component